MIQKEEDTVVLLSSEERQGEGRRLVHCVKKNSFIASSFAASCLCGAGLFVSNLILWCPEPETKCKDTELVRYSVLVGGIISSLISGRAVDVYGRRSSLIFAATCWFIATIFIIFSSFPARNSHYVPVVSPQDMTTYRIASLEVTSTYFINSLESHVSVSRSLNSPSTFHVSPTQPSSTHSISFQSNVPHINIPRQSSGNVFVANSSRGNFDTVENNNVHSLIKPLDSDWQFSSSIPFVVSHLFIGAASTASITSASVYVYETSHMNFRARWLSFSDFFSALFALSLPIIRSHLLILTAVACLPIIFLSLLHLLPFNMPNCLSLPHSPYHLLLCSIVHKRKLLSHKSTWFNRNGSVGNIDSRCTSNRECKSNPLGHVFCFYGKMTHWIANIFKFNSANSKVYDINSRKNSAGDSDDSSCCMNDVVKYAELETEMEKLQPVQIENHGWADSVHYRKSQFEEGDELFLGECSSVVENDCSDSKDSDIDMNMLEREDESLVSFDRDRGVAEGSYFRSINSESNERDADEQLEGSSIMSIQERYESLGAEVTWQEAEAHRILTHLYGSRKGQEEWETIRRTFVEDAEASGSCASKSSFITNMHRFRRFIQTISKIGVPLIVIHMCASDLGETVTVSEIIMSRMRFCDVSAQTMVSALQVMSTGISVLLLDKLYNQIVILTAAMVMATSLMALGFLSPYIKLLTDDARSPIFVNSITPSPPISTMYPLLPTPLPQILKNEQNSCMEGHWKDSRFSAINQVENAQDSQMYVTSESPIVWLTAISVVSFVAAGSLILAPLTRLILLSAFPTSGQGNGIGISFAIQYAVRLIILFVPYTLCGSSLGLIFRAGACFSSIIVLLCFLSIKNQSRCCCLQHNSYNKRFFHLLSDGQICNMSTINSTAV